MDSNINNNEISFEELEQEDIKFETHKGLRKARKNRRQKEKNWLKDIDE